MPKIWGIERKKDKKKKYVLRRLINYCDYDYIDSDLCYYEDGKEDSERNKDYGESGEEEEIRSRPTLWNQF